MIIAPKINGLISLKVSESKGVHCQIQNEYCNGLVDDLSTVITRYIYECMDSGAHIIKPDEVWFDDALLLTLDISNHTMQSGGLIIYGVGGSTEQFIAPFYIDIKIDYTKLSVFSHTIAIDFSKVGNLSYNDYADRRDHLNQLLLQTKLLKKFKSENWAFVDVYVRDQ